MKKLILLALGVILSLSLCACQGNHSEQETEKEPSSSLNGQPATSIDGQPGAIINGQPIYYLDENDLQSLEEPMAKLLANVIPMEFAKAAPQSSYDPDSPAVPFSYSCGLVDANQDGTPELLLHPFGYYGSSGMVTYYVYDILSGQKVGKIGSGSAATWREYYNTGTGSFHLIGRYRTQYGWEEQNQYITTVEFNQEFDGYYGVDVFSMHHRVAHEEVETEADGSVLWREVYPDTTYRAYGQSATLDEYYDAYYAFTDTCIPLPETQLILLRWEAVCDEDDDNAERARKMAAALLKTGQKFVDIKKHQEVLGAANSGKS